MLIKNHNIIILRYILYVVKKNIDLRIVAKNVAVHPCTGVSFCSTSQYYTFLLLWLIAFIINGRSLFSG